MGNDKIQHFRTFEELGEFYRTKPLSRSAICESSNTHYIHYGDIHGKFDGFIDHNTPLPNIEDIDFDDVVIDGDLIFADASEDYNDLGKTVLIEAIDDRRIISGLHTHAYRPNSELVHPTFLKYYTDSPLFRKEMRKKGQGISVLGISKKEINKILIKLPPKSIQEKYAKGLRNIDYKITFLEEQLENLKIFKKGYKQKLFQTLDQSNSREIRMKEILSEVVEKTTCSNQYDVLSSTTSGLYKQSKYFKREVASKDTTGYKILRKYQFVMSPQNAWMGNYNLNMDFEIGIVSPSYKVFEVNELIPKPLFAELIDTKRFRYDIVCSSEQGASVVRRNLNLPDFMDIKIKVPSNQNHLNVVESFIVDLNQKILRINSKLKTLKQFKKGLLQQMFI